MTPIVQGLGDAEQGHPNHGNNLQNSARRLSQEYRLADRQTQLSVNLFLALKHTSKSNLRSFQRNLHDHAFSVVQGHGSFVRDVKEEVFIIKVDVCTRNPVEIDACRFTFIALTIQVEFNGIAGSIFNISPCRIECRNVPTPPGFYRCQTLQRTRRYIQLELNNLNPENYR